ncbi:hypothetical protein [Flavisphingomonas formosensis]|uniref:hypothetical protein n=1 Tax=Flavisphingomonas formosensis TaxID=861534 RepID=UPI0012F8D146|nr:hypothetical protein [Sphingomonas formosensis]
MALKLLTLAKLIGGQPIVDIQGAPSNSFLRWANDLIVNITASFNASVQNQTDIATALETAGIAVTTATDALDAVDGQAAVLLQASLTQSFTDPLPALSVDAVPSSAPTSATITITAHTRRYTDGRTVSVNGDTIAGLALGSGFYVYYNDLSQTGGSVTYSTTTNPLTAAQIGGRHCVGYCSTSFPSGVTHQDGVAAPPAGVPVV